MNNTDLLNFTPEDLLFYDIECFKYDALVVFMDYSGQEIAHFWSTKNRTTVEEPSGFEGVRELIQDKILVGYNNYHYDDIMLTVFMNPVQSMYAHQHNNTIIFGSGSSVKVDPDIKSLDCMQQIDVSKPGLKKIEGNMGLSIVESSVDFTIDRPLTDEEREETLRYCRYDVQSTIKVYKARVAADDYFSVKQKLVHMLPEDQQERAMRWNTTTISAMILTGGKRLKYWDTLKIPEKYWRKVNGIPSSVWDMWEEATTDDNLLKKGYSKKIKAFDCEIVFGLGGLHGAPTKPVEYGKVLHADVGSMYPSIICKLSALDNATEIYDGLRKERLSIKKSDPVRAGALKLVLNSVYGNFKSKYSTLFNPRASATICIFGQIALFKLCSMLHGAGYQIININTDGVVFVDDPSLGDTYDTICRQWEQEFDPLLLEIDVFTRWIQKDVNNYIAVQEDGSLYLKGGDTNKYSKDKLFANNDCRIVQMAMVEYLLNKTPIEVTLHQHVHEPQLWQYVLKAGSTFLGVCDANGSMQQKVNRVFATYSNQNYKNLYKTRDGQDRINFPDAPEFMYVHNGDVSELADIFPDIVNRGHYVDLVRKKIEGWGKCVL